MRRAYDYCISVGPTLLLEIPTPRWTAYDAQRYTAKMDDNVWMKLQERA
jgi:hypothetical protein